MWCWSCEKCVFVFLILSPFLGIEKTTNIFWKNILNDESLGEIFLALIGHGWEKPFECVGTPEESLLAAKKILSWKSSPVPYIIQKYAYIVEKECWADTEKVLENKLSKIYNDHIIPKKFTQFL